MDKDDLTVVLDCLELASESMKRRAVKLIRAAIPSLEGDGDLEVEDAQTVPEEVYQVLHHAITGRPIPVNHEMLEREARKLGDAERSSFDTNSADGKSLYWFVHVQTPRGRAHLKDYGILPSRATQALVRECVESGYTFLAKPPVCVRPITHYGKSVGMGLVALAPFARGHMIMQFTGTVHDLSNGARFMVGRRQDYVINVRYLGRNFTIDPLDATTHQHVDLPHYAAYINEPSRPPFPSGTLARERASRLNVVVKAYEYKTGKLRVEFDDRRQENLSPEDLVGVEGDVASPTTYRANCAWFDFPVPLNDLYRKKRVRSNGMVVYERTALHACTVTFHGADELLIAFEAHHTMEGSFNMYKGLRPLPVEGDVLTLRDDDERLPGLRRHGVVVGVRGNKAWDVHFRLDPQVAPRLPRFVYAGPSAKRGYDVPFPCIHACRDIRVGEELLCLYDKPLHTRGVGCHALLSDSDIRLPWYEYAQ